MTLVRRLLDKAAAAQREEEGLDLLEPAPTEKVRYTVGRPDGAAWRTVTRTIELCSWDGELLEVRTRTWPLLAYRVGRVSWWTFFVVGLALALLADALGLVAYVAGGLLVAAIKVLAGLGGVVATVTEQVTGD